MQTESCPDYYHNGYVILDYQDGSNYNYAGMADGSNTWIIGQRANGIFSARVSVSKRSRPGSGITWKP